LIKPLSHPPGELLSPSPIYGRGVGEREAFAVVVDFAVAVAVAVVFALALLGPHKAVAAEPAEKTREGEGQDARVFLQDRDVL